jgi:hypothetical protein
MKNLCCFTYVFTTCMRDLLPINSTFLHFSWLKKSLGLIQVMFLLRSVIYKALFFIKNDLLLTRFCSLVYYVSYTEYKLSHSSQNVPLALALSRWGPIKKISPDLCLSPLSRILCFSSMILSPNYVSQNGLHSYLNNSSVELLQNNGGKRHDSCKHLKGYLEQVQKLSI